MQDCFRKYPEVYGEEIADEEAAEREAEAAAAGSPAAGGDVQSTSSKDTEPATSASTKSVKPEATAKREDTSSIVAASVDHSAHDATAVNTKSVATEAPKPVASESPAAAPRDGNSKEFKDRPVDGHRAVPKSSFDATSANAKASK